MAGRFGPYVKFGAVNATLPRDKAPEELTVDEAIALIAARAAKGGGGRKPAQAAASKAAKRATKTPAKGPRKRRPKHRPSAPQESRGRCRGRLIGQARASRSLPGCPPRLSYWNSCRRAAARPVSAKSRAPSTIKGGDRIALKAMLKGLADSGKLARRHRRLIDTSTLPPIAAVEIVGLDPDGELIGVPLEWDETVLGKPPRILIEAGTGSSREDMQPPARGDRILAKIEPTSDPVWPFKARIVRRLSDPVSAYWAFSASPRDTARASFRSTRRRAMIFGCSPATRTARATANSFPPRSAATLAADSRQRGFASASATWKISATSR